MTLHANRRNFLRGAVGAALLVGFRSDGALAAGDASADLNPFVRIEADGTVTVILKHFEMGQGTTTGLATLVAEEIDADWARVAVDFAPADTSRYANLFFGGQGTGGSTAIANSYIQYRRAGAAARDLLVRAAAATWGVDASAVTVENSVLKSGDRTAHFGEMAVAAAALAPVADPVLKESAKFRLIGDAALPRKDSAPKTDGTAQFAMDAKIDGMVHAVILRPANFGAKLVSFDASGAASVPGFVDAKALGNGAGVAVFGKTTWAAISAREAITAEWDLSAAETRSSAELLDYHRSLTETPEHKVHEADVSGLDSAAQVIEAEFTFPFLAHAPMEPLTCIIEPTAEGVRFHDGCQFPGIVQPTIAAVLGLADPMKVEVVTLYAGGSFGRRATPDADYHVEAALAFAALGGQTPVKLVWTREDDLRGGYYRPMAYHRARVGLDAGGRIAAWDHRVAVKSILKGSPFEAALVHGGIDETSVEGVGGSPYAIPNFAVGLSDAQYPAPILWWRSVGHTHTAFAMESLMDMAAHAAGMDPVEYRLALLPPDTKDRERMAGVLRLAAEKAGWGSPAGEGRGRGVAVHKSFNSYVAQVVDVSVTDGMVSIDRVVCAVDCGVAVNPGVIAAQMEGGIGYGLGAVMRNAITLAEGGEVEQWNFPDYEPLRISDMPEVEVHIVASAEDPTGVGEPGVPPVGPALANAIFAATGTRVTALPMIASGVEFA